MYLVYDTKESEQCVGIFDNLAEVAEFFNTTKDCVSCAISRRVRKKWRYQIIKMDDSLLEGDDDE